MNPYSNRSTVSTGSFATAARLAGLGLALGLFAGCNNDDSLPLVALSGTTPEFATTTPRAAAATPLVVHQAPPASLKESILDRPSVLHVWITGYWAWQDDKYQWTAGHWELPPRGMDKWVAPRWEKNGDSYVFTEGSWR